MISVPDPRRPNMDAGRWARLRHLFVECLSDSSEISQRLVLVEPNNAPESVDQWEALEFPHNLLPWVTRYRQVGNRSLYLWRWCLYAVDRMTLSSVGEAWLPATRDMKFLVGMFNCLIDDVIDHDHNPRLFRALLSLFHGGTPVGESEEEQKQAEFVTEVWNEIWRRAGELPRFAEFKTLLEFDLRQVATTVEHSDLMSQLPEMVNQIEHDLYSAHGMTVTVAATIDLMASPDFDRKDLAGLRSLLWHAESMARIGNLVSTWEREIPDGDFTSGVFMEAVWRGLLKPEQLRSDNQEELKATIIQSDIEADFLRKWEHHRKQVRSLGSKLKSVDIENYVGRLDQLLESELFSHGRK